MEPELIKFGAEVQRLKDAGVREGHAIRQARAKHGKGYHLWCVAGRPTAARPHTELLRRNIVGL